jgi:hypothetical protein
MGRLSLPVVCVVLLLTAAFTTARADDHPGPAAPAAPAIRRLRLSVPEVPRAGAAPVEIDLDAAFDPSVAFVTFAVQTADGSWSAKVRPDDVRWLGHPGCDAPMPALHPGQHVRVRLSAVDLAGNLGPATEREVVVEQPTHLRCGLGPTVTVIAGLALGAIALIVFGMWGIVQMCWFGGVRRPTVESEPGWRAGSSAAAARSRPWRWSPACRGSCPPSTASSSSRRRSSA